jgi:hypothetical protein
MGLGLLQSVTVQETKEHVIALIRALEGRRGTIFRPDS